MNTTDVCKPLSLGRGEMSLGCDEGRFIFPEESRLRAFGGGLIHSLTKSELAQLYFPGAPRSSALRLLHKYITSAHGLLPALEQVGYQRTSRRLTRRQVQLIFEYLGEP